MYTTYTWCTCTCTRMLLCVCTHTCCACNSRMLLTQQLRACVDAQHVYVVVYSTSIQYYTVLVYTTVYTYTRAYAYSTTYCYAYTCTTSSLFSCVSCCACFGSWCVCTHTAGVARKAEGLRAGSAPRYAKAEGLRAGQRPAFARGYTPCSGLRTPPEYACYARLHAFLSSGCARYAGG